MLKPARRPQVQHQHSLTAFRTETNITERTEARVFITMGQDRLCLRHISLQGIGTLSIRGTAISESAAQKTGNLVRVILVI